MTILSLSLKFSIDCGHCGETLPVNKAAEQTRCDRCGEETWTPPALWQRLVTENLVEATTLEPETDSWANGILAGVGNYSMEYGKMLPRCTDGCGSIWKIKDVLSIAEKGHSVFRCTGCDKIWSIRKPPEWFNTVAPHVSILVGEEAPDDSGGKYAGNEGISIFCYHCGGHLSLDGESRKVTCEYCSQDLLVPDEVWSRLHPVTVARPWYILLDMGEHAALLPHDIDEFIDLEAMPNGDTILLWEEDSTGHIGRADRTGGLLWQTRDFELSDYARLLYNRQENMLWVLDTDQHLVYAFDAETGKKTDTIKNRKENGKTFTAMDHEGIAICSDGTIVIYRRWGEEANEPKRMIPDKRGRLVYAEEYVFYPNRLRRFDNRGKRIPLWEGHTDEDLARLNEVTFEQLADQPPMVPEGAWLMGGPDKVLYVVDRVKGIFVRFDRQGILLGTMRPTMEEVVKIQDCGVAADSTIYILFDHRKKINQTNYSHVGKINSDGLFQILAGPHSEVNNFPLGTDMERMAVSENGELHLCDYNFNNFRILAPDGSLLWRSPGTVVEDETLAEELAGDRK